MIFSEVLIHVIVWMNLEYIYVYVYIYPRAYIHIQAKGEVGSRG